MKGRNIKKIKIIQLDMKDTGYMARGESLHIRVKSQIQVLCPRLMKMNLKMNLKMMITPGMKHVTAPEILNQIIQDLILMVSSVIIMRQLWIYFRIIILIKKLLFTLTRAPFSLKLLIYGKHMKKISVMISKKLCPEKRQLRVLI